MPQIIEIIDVDVPVRTAYNAWTRFEEFPRFLRFVKKVEHIDDTHLRWTVSVVGATRQFEAEITEQRPDERVAWRSTSGEVTNTGVVTFHRLDRGRSRVTVQIDWEARDFVAAAGAVLGVDDRLVEIDLERFKSYVESRHAEGHEIRGWREHVEWDE